MTKQLTRLFLCLFWTSWLGCSRPAGVGAPLLRTLLARSRQADVPTGGRAVRLALLALLARALLGAPCATPVAVVYFPPDPQLEPHPDEIVVQQEIVEEAGPRWVDSGGRVREGDCAAGHVLLLANLRSCYAGLDAEARPWEVCSERTRQVDCAAEPCVPVEETCAAGALWVADDWSLLRPAPEPEPDPVPTPAVVRQRLVDCVGFTVLAEMDWPGQRIEVGPLAAGACLGLATFGDSLTTSLGYDYDSLPAQLGAVPFHGELHPPFCFTGDAGWVVTGQIPRCTADPAKARLTMPGEHMLTVTPCSVDPTAWGIGSKADQCLAAGGVPGEPFTTTVVVGG